MADAVAKDPPPPVKVAVYQVVEDIYVKSQQPASFDRARSVVEVGGDVVPHESTGYLASCRPLSARRARENRSK